MYIYTYTHICCKVITTITSVNRSPHEITFSLCVVIKLKTYYPNIQVYNTVLLIITTMLYIKSFEFTYLISLHPLIKINPFPQPLSPC